jgi:hypothetical protein
MWRQTTVQKGFLMINALRISQNLTKVATERMWLDTTDSDYFVQVHLENIHVLIRAGFVIKTSWSSIKLLDVTSNALT